MGLCEIKKQIYSKGNYQQREYTAKGVGETANCTSVRCEYQLLQKTANVRCQKQGLSQTDTNQLDTVFYRILFLLEVSKSS